MTVCAGPWRDSCRHLHFAVPQADAVSRDDGLPPNPDEISEIDHCPLGISEVLMSARSLLTGLMILGVTVAPPPVTVLQNRTGQSQTSSHRRRNQK